MKKRTLMPSERVKPSTSLQSIESSQMAGLYDLEETLGKGHYAVVKAARHVFTGERVAVKVIDKTKLDEISKKALLKEVLCMKLVQHPNVVRLYEVIDTTSKTYLVLELGKGDLYDLIVKEQGGLNEDLAHRYFAQIVSAVSYCHKLHVAHRDLKPENVVYFPEDHKVKLTDFGLSNRYCPGVKMDTSCGSLAYSAPEILLGDSYDAPAVDVWSLGVILYMLVCGRAPFQEANDSETLTMIMDVKYSIPNTVSPLCADLISRMLVRVPDKRATLSEIENDPWLCQDDYLSELPQLPLISHQTLNVEEKDSIIRQMVSGNICSEDEIFKLLDSGAYNYITATYFLLAEKCLRERGEKSDKLEPTTAVTGSLESLSDRRKNSGHSDDEQASSEESSLAPLDLDVKSATTTKGSGAMKSGRFLTSVISSAVSELDKTLPILEEDGAPHSEEEDSAGPLVSRVSQSLRSRCEYSRRVTPQRSTSCSSSEDEDSERKKRSLHHHKPKNKSNRSCAPDNRDQSLRKSGDSSDEQSGGCSESARLASSILLNTTLVRKEDKEQCSKESNENHASRSQEESVDASYPDVYGLKETHQQTGRSAKDWRVCYEDKISVDEQCLISRKISMSNSVPDNSGWIPNISSKFSSDGIVGNRNEVANVFLSDMNDEVKGTNPVTNFETSSHHPKALQDTRGSLAVAKKGKKLLLGWLFLKKRRRHNVEGSSQESSKIPSSSGIYKTQSCAELKLKNCLMLSPVDVNQNM